jgi:hypothetical protein
VGKANYAFALAMLLFILMSSLTVMNMLIGVLVEVVSVVAAVEKEQMTMRYVKTMLLKMLSQNGMDRGKNGMDEDSDITISRHQFEQLLMKPQAARIIQDVGVDVVGLVDFMDFIFKDGEKLSFPEFMDVVLQLRGSNNATVRDVVDLRKYVQNQLHEVVGCLSGRTPESDEMQSRVSSANSQSESANKADGRSSFDTKKQDTPSTSSGSRPSSIRSPRSCGANPVAAFPDLYVSEFQDDFASEV